MILCTSDFILYEIPYFEHKILNIIWKLDKYYN